MRSRLLLLLLGLGVALGVHAAESAALCLPAGEPSGRWSDAAALGGFRVAAVDSGERVIVTAEGARWHLRAVDARGGVHDATVPVPVTAQAREDLVWLARSLLKPSGEGGWGPPRTAYTPLPVAPVPRAVAPPPQQAAVASSSTSSPKSSPSSSPVASRPAAPRAPASRPAAKATASEDASLWLAPPELPALPVSGSSPWSGVPPAALAAPPLAALPVAALPVAAPLVAAPPVAALPVAALPVAAPPVAGMPVAAMPVAAVPSASVASVAAPSAASGSLAELASPPRLGLATGLGGALGYRGDTGLGVALRLDVVAELRWLRISASGTWQPEAMLDALGAERRASQFGFGGGLGWMGAGRVRPLAMVESGVALRRYTQANLIVADLAVPFAGVRAGARWSLSPEVLLEPYAALYMDLMPVTFETEEGRTAASWGAGSVGVTVLGQFGANSRLNSEE